MKREEAKGEIEGLIWILSTGGEEASRAGRGQKGKKEEEENAIFGSCCKV